MPKIAAKAVRVPSKVLHDAYTKKLAGLLVEQTAYEASRPGQIAWPEGPLYKHAANEKLAGLELRFSGRDSSGGKRRADRFALMLAIRVCANHDLPLPGWVSKAYIAAFDQVLAYHARSWDEVFGSPVKVGRKLGGLRLNREKGVAARLAYSEVQNRRRIEPAKKHRQTPIEETAEKIGLSVTKTKELLGAPPRKSASKKSQGAKKAKSRLG